MTEAVPLDHDTPVLDDDGRVLWVPTPPEPASELYPGLWVGGCARGAGGVNDPGTYDRVLTLCGRGEEEPLARRVREHRRYRMWDNADPPPPVHLSVAVGWVVRMVRRGDVVLVRCWAGLNRSGLIGTLALAELTGLDGPTALRAARAHRSRWLLCNPAFAALVEAVPARPRTDRTETP